LDFQAELGKANINTPIIFMSGYGDIPMSVKAMKAGAVDFLTKPFRDQDMLDAVATALARDRRRRETEKRVSDLRSRFDTLTPREDGATAVKRSPRGARRARGGELRPLIPRRASIAPRLDLHCRANQARHKCSSSFLSR